MVFDLKKYFAKSELSPEERREVLEDLFAFGKVNQFPFLVRMSVLLVLSTIIAIGVASKAWVVNRTGKVTGHGNSTDRIALVVTDRDRCTW